jgi:hypothetical protein
MVAVRTRFPRLMVVLLVMVLAGQAVAASEMSCRGTASCCCQPRATATDMADALPTGMSHDTRPACCDTTPSQPCDIASNGHPDSAPFLVTASVERVDSFAPVGLTFSPVAPMVTAAPALYDGLLRPDRDGPPLYLVLQSFLC